MRRLTISLVLMFASSSVMGTALWSPARARAADQEERGLTIKNSSEATVAVAPEVWDKLPRTSVKVQTPEGETTYDGVQMAEILKLVGAPLGKELRGKMLARY